MTTEEELIKILNNSGRPEYFMTSIPKQTGMILIDRDKFLPLMKEAYNLAIQTAANNVKLKDKGKFVASTGYSKYMTRQVIDKKSILKLKIK